MCESIDSSNKWFRLRNALNYGWRCWHDRDDGNWGCWGVGAASKRRPSALRAYRSSDVYFRNAACRFLGRAFEPVKKIRQFNWNIKSAVKLFFVCKLESKVPCRLRSYGRVLFGQPSSAPLHCDPAVSLLWQSSRGFSPETELFGVHVPWLEEITKWN